MKRYLNAQEVAAELNISVATVYAYVSRGMLRSEADGPHSRRYLREDVEKLKARKQTRQNPAAALGEMAQQALHWGTPVLDSALTLIDNGQLYYRGRSVVELARTASVEAVAALLWVGDPEQASQLFTEESPLIPELDPNLRLLSRFSVALPMMEAHDLSAYDFRPAALYRTAVRILRLLVAIATQRRESIPIGTALAQAWCPNNPAAEPLLRAALIVCADHELNVSSFTARCVASAAAPLHAVVSAGLAALQGVKHGRQTELATLLLTELADVDDVTQAIAQKLRLGQALPGFGHNLYPQGDPRGHLLINMVQQAFPDAPISQLLNDLLSAADALYGEPLTVDLGLAAVHRALKLPEGDAMALFALGRTIGWIGHAIEQYATGQLIRPRARYIGKSPSKM